GLPDPAAPTTDTPCTARTWPTRAPSRQRSHNRAPPCKGERPALLESSEKNWVDLHRCLALRASDGLDWTRAHRRAPPASSNEPTHPVRQLRRRKRCPTPRRPARNDSRPAWQCSTPCTTTPVTA